MCVDKKRNRIGRTLILLAAGAIVAGVMAASANAQSYTLSQNGKGIGSASLSLRPGVAVTSGAKIDMPGLKYSFNETAQLDPGYHLVSVKLSGSVNGSTATVNAQPQGQQVVVTFAMKPEKVKAVGTRDLGFVNAIELGGAKK